MRPVSVVYSTTLGGAEAYLVNLYSSLAARGHRPHLVGAVPGWLDAQLASSNLAFSPKWGRRTILKGLVLLRNERKMVVGAIQGLNADMFHLQFKREQIGFTELLAKQAPVVWTEHGIFPQGLRGLALRKAYADAARHTTLIICVSTRVAREVSSIVGPGISVITIENSVDIEKTVPPTREEKLAAKRALGLGDQPVALWIGRLAPSKRPEAALKIAEKFDGIVLLAGSGELLPVIRERAKAHANVVVLGHVDDPSSLYRASDVTLFTSDGSGEGLPTTFLEAAAHGVPTIADSSSGFGSLVESDAGGASVPAGSDAQTWVDLIDSVSDSVHARNARKWAEEHDRGSWVQKHERALQAAIAASP